MMMTIGCGLKKFFSTFERFLTEFCLFFFFVFWREHIRRNFANESDNAVNLWENSTEANLFWLVNRLAMRRSPRNGELVLSATFFDCKNEEILAYMNESDKHHVEISVHRFSNLHSPISPKVMMKMFFLKIKNKN